MKQSNLQHPGYKLFLATLLLFGQFLTLVALPTPTYACTQLPTQWWYRETMTITEDILPDSISVRLRYADYANSRQTLIFSNSSIEPLYILAPAGSADYYSGVEPAGVPQELIVHTTVNQLDSHFQMEQLARLDTNFVDNNRWFPNRPDQLQIPASGSTRINLLFEDQLYFVNLEIDYEINSSFTSNPGNAGCHDLYQLQVEQEESNQASFTLLGVFTFIALGAAALIFRRRPRPGKWLE